MAKWIWRQHRQTTCSFHEDTIICQLTIPNAAKADFVDYYCRVKLQLSSKTFNRNCYLLSETVTMTPSKTSLSDTDVMMTHENNVSTVYIAAIITAFIVFCLILLSIIPVMIVVKTIKKCYQERKYEPPLELREPLNGTCQCIYTIIWKILVYMHDAHMHSCIPPMT